MLKKVPEPGPLGKKKEICRKISEPTLGITNLRRREKGIYRG